MRLLLDLCAVAPAQPDPTRTARVVARLATAAALGVVAFAALSTRVEVEGRSMSPTLLPGDRLLLLRRGRIRPGDIVAAPDPRDHRRRVVKRVGGVGAGGLDLRGDDPARSTDSRTFGPVPRSSVLGRAVWRYAPPDRTGRIRHPG
jgi:nickel-type superoxide dismutase maturation protease